MNAIVTALMPLLITAATVVLAMLTIALRRDSRLTVGVTFVGVALAFVSLVPSMIADVSATSQSAICSWSTAWRASRWR